MLSSFCPFRRWHPFHGQALVLPSILAFQLQLCPQSPTASGFDKAEIRSSRPSAGQIAATPQAPPAVSLIRSPQTLTAAPLTLAIVQTSDLSALAKELGVAPAPVLLTVEMGPISYTRAFVIRVFVNKPDATQSTSTEDAHYVAVMPFSDSPARAKEAGTSLTNKDSIQFTADDRHFFTQMQIGLSSITLVPLTPTGNDETFGITLKGLSLKVDRSYPLRRRA